MSNEATSEVGYPAWPAGRTCLSFFFLTVFLSCSLLLPGFCSALRSVKQFQQLQVFPTFSSRLVKPLEISVFTHGLSDMALWAGLAICGSPVQGDDVQKFTFSSTSHCTACLLNKAALMRYQAPQLHSHCTACLLNKAALTRYQAPEASCASDKPVRHRLCSSLIHALRRLRSVQFKLTIR